MSDTRRVGDFLVPKKVYICKCKSISEINTEINKEGSAKNGCVSYSCK